MQSKTIQLLSPLVSVGLVLGATPNGEPPPLDPGLKERVEVRLVMLDVLVLDRKGEPVPNLTAEDFDVEIDHHAVPLAGFDAMCGDTAQKPNIVLAFDYQHLSIPQRGQILAEAKDAVDRGAAGDSSVMVAALTGGLRVELPFTKDGQRVEKTLAHMRDDPTLFAANFSHSSDDGFVRGLTSLFDVAGTSSRPTAVILYSAMEDGPIEEHFRALAAQAAEARCAVYPFHVAELTAGPRPTEGMKPKLQDPTGAVRPTGKTILQMLQFVEDDPDANPYAMIEAQAGGGGRGGCG